MLPRFDERTATEMAAYILNRLGGSTEYIKLIKLMYLADRKALEEHQMPISTDRYVSMKYGPVLSNTFDLVRHPPVYDVGDFWNEHIEDIGQYQVRLTKKVPPAKLSLAQEEILGLTCDEFGSWPWGKLVEYTHDLPEWKNPDADQQGPGSLPLLIEDILIVGMKKDQKFVSEVRENLTAAYQIEGCGEP